MLNVAKADDLFWTRVELERTSALLHGLVATLIKKDLLSEEDLKQVFETAMMASSSEHASDDFEQRAKRKSQETYNLYFYQEGDFQARLRNYREHYFKTQYNPSNYDQY